MNLTFTINGVNRTDRIRYPFVTKVDQINQNKDKLNFSVHQVSNAIWKPEVDDEIVVTDGATKVFGGAVVSVKQKAQVANYLEYSVECLDYSFYLDRRLVLERFRNRTVAYIIDFILDKYDTDGFTMNNVIGDTSIGSMSFNRITMGEALQKLADAIGYSWYIDYDKDIHFFPKNTEPAPFELNDTNGTFIWDSLEIDRSISQIRNAVFVEGGDEQGNPRTEEFFAEGTDEDRRYYRTANKFAEKPTVKVNGTAVNVGVEFLQQETGFAAMWSFQEKYIRFTDGNIPAEADNIEINGIPLFPVVVRVQNPPSISEFGLWEFVVRDNSIRSRDEALLRAQAELQAYKTGVVEASFNTYTPGLRSGHVITINSTIHNINESFLIQQVTMQTRSQDSAEYKVRLATLRTISLVELLQNMLKEKGVREGESETLLTLLDLIDEGQGDDEIVSITTTSAPYTIADAAGNVTTGTAARVNFSKLSSV